MAFLFDVALEVHQHLVELIGVVASSDGLILGLLHLSGSYELHRAGDLGSAFYRFDASANVAEVGHVLGKLGVISEQ
jgi:hypothetical protein